MAYAPDTNKIDSLATNGLAGVSNSLAYRVHEIEKHFHNREKWLGKSVAGTDADACLDTITVPFALTCGAGSYGASVIPIVGSGNGPFFTAGDSKFDLHKILLISAVDAKLYKFRISYGTTAYPAFADAITQKQYSEFMVYVNAVTGSTPSAEIEIMMPRVDYGKTVWIEGWSDAGNAVTFYIALHEYKA